MRINNRPLTYIDDAINHPQPLTPSHLIHGRRLRSLPVTEDKLRDPDYGCTHDHMNQRYSYLNQTQTLGENMENRIPSITAREILWSPRS